ncbi:hypothetical protein K7H08_15125 [Halomonas sp. IOP_6]|uniref:gamma-mobile-trio recombinase GmtY n=1 Tax=Halomonas sp. IOP_6 TaxID=2876583 RepID=UPI001E477C1D|nr:gamma-mobile-trio recombinase GmtY [Halomonas sp. IOP_6]MCD6006169.1 hypothetical protein [Halomonas sp. IOP_6]
MYLNSAVVKVRAKIDNHSASLAMKAIAVNGAILKSHLEYMIYGKLRGRRSGWMDKSIQAVRLLIDYSYANGDTFKNPAIMFETFAQRLFDGTVDEEGFDPTGLRWQPRSKGSGNEIIRHITLYSDWLYDQKDGASELLNPRRVATKSEKLMNLAAYNNRMNRSFLKHTYSIDHKTNEVSRTRAVSYRNEVSITEDPQKPFEEDKIWDLLGQGFLKKGKSINDSNVEKYDLSNILITMLMHYGGLRVSEPFHLYVDDIIPNEGLQQIRVYHPREGLAPQWYRHLTNSPNCNRKTFLKIKYGLEDRVTSSKKSYHAGWKNPTVSSVGKYFPVFLFGDNIQDVFYDLFRLYVENQRVKPLPGREHPFLFTNKIGDPLSIKSFVQKHNKAVNRIGLSHYLELGGSPHCHRHAYGQRLAEARNLSSNIDEYIIKGALHHRSLESQKTYTDPHTKKIARELKKVASLVVSDKSKNAKLDLIEGN